MEGKMLFLPTVRIRQFDWDCLMQLAFAPEHSSHPAAPFLRAEVHRAIVTDDFSLNQIVHLNGLVSYRLDGQDMASRLLVHPDDDDVEGQLPVFSPLGAALIGIRVGDVMPFACPSGTLHSVMPLALQPERKRASSNSLRSPHVAIPFAPNEPCCRVSANQTS
jgi:regulator of nucleoside diphosphate kinase